MVGFLVTTVRYKPLYNNVYMKLYAALEERGLPLAFHAATNWGDQSMNITNRFIATHALGFTWFNIVHMTNWVVNGMPERFPGLKSIWIESGLAWIPFLMQRLDNEYMMRSSEAPTLKRKPSDYMREMYLHLAADGDGRQPHDAGRNLQDDQRRERSSSTPPTIRIGTWTCRSTIYDLPFLSQQAKRNILGENARKLFKLDNFVSAEKMARRKARQMQAAE